MSGDRDYEWPTFDDADTRAISSYSPDPEREKIFTEFKLATDTPRNKKRKPRKSAATRLTSETEVLGNRYKHRDCRRFLMIAALVACIIIIIGIGVGLGIYFGVVAKPSEEGPKAEASHDVTVDVETISTPTTMSTKVTQKSTVPVFTVPLTTPSSTTTPTPSTTPSTTTPTTTTPTTTTSTTTTTAPPTKPPTLPFSAADEAELVTLGRSCWAIHMFSFSASMNVETKCGLFAQVLQCVYFDLLVQRVHCPIAVMVESIKNNSKDVIPQWTGFDPDICLDQTGSFPIGNVSVLPVTKEGACTSPDAVTYYWKDDCFTKFNQMKVMAESEDNKCRLFISYIGCIAHRLGCPFDDVRNTQQISPLHDSTSTIVNRTYCEAWNQTAYLSDPESAACEDAVSQAGSQIFKVCGPILEETAGTKDDLNLQCRLYDEFTVCLGVVVTYPCAVSQLKTSGYQLASLQASLAADHLFQPPLINVTSCEGFVQPSSKICEDAELLIAMVDTKCSGDLKYSLPGEACKNMDKYIQCVINFVQAAHRETCTHSQVLRSAKQQTTDGQHFYDIDISSCS